MKTATFIPTKPASDPKFEESLMHSMSPTASRATLPQPGSGTTTAALTKSATKSVVPALADDEDLEHLTVKSLGINLDTTFVYRNSSVPFLYEHALHYEEGTAISSTGALMCYSGKRTGRSPKDKRIVEEESTIKDIWWGPVNIKMSEKTFTISRERAVDFLNTCKRLYVIDAYAGWHKDYRMKIRIITNRAYHALFMRDMLVLPTREELLDFGTPDFTVYNAGDFPANRYTVGMTSNACVAINFKAREMVILGTQYAGEMKKGIFTVMHYYMPKRGVLSLHSSANEGPKGDVSLFFGLSGTGKTTLSADPHRKLIGDDEHVWYEGGVFNIEGGCYAKCIKLSAESEPEIFNAIRFGAVLENVVYDKSTREVDYDDYSITQNTRTAYPIEFIPNAKIPCMGGHPSNIILLTCDAFGVLPPVAMLTPEQVMYYFIAGYTAKVEGTEVGVTEPEATFSACFGDAFLAWHPTKYAELLAQFMLKHKANAWLVNTGWIGGSYGVGTRIKIRYTRAMIDAIHSGELMSQKTFTFPIFNLQVPEKCPGVPDEVLNPRKMWKDPGAFDANLKRVAELFLKNFKQFSSTDAKSREVEAYGPKVEA